MEHINQHRSGKVHMIGIGGSSMSGLASILLDKGYRVSGSDIADSAIIGELRARGVTVHIGHDAKNIEGATLVVYTAAVHPDNPELCAARAAGIPTMERAVLLGQLMAQYEIAIGISGTHGKTTTTSLVATVLELAETHPTIHIGGKLDLIGGSTKSGTGNIFVTEACEYVESFLKFHPTIAVILNIDNDHLDYFHDIDHIQQAFTRYAGLVPAAGSLIVNADDFRCMQVLETAACHKITFAIDNETANWRAVHVEFNESGFASFDVLHDGEFFGRFSLRIPGRHHVYNALAAIAVTHCCGMDAEAMLRGFAAFHGAERRFDLCGVKNGMRIVHDYAHHPSEIRALIAAAALQHPGRIVAVFQPHTYSRLSMLFDDFAAAFDGADETIVTDIYAAREANPGNVHPEALVSAISERGNDCRYIGPFDEIADFVVENGREGDLILTIGAGTIEKLGKMILEK